jgi:broad specificity phosphatase PhoE
MDIIFIRHGETEDNLKRVLSKDDVLLTKRGEEQIKKITPFVEELENENVYISP